MASSFVKSELLALAPNTLAETARFPVCGRRGCPVPFGRYQTIRPSSIPSYRRAPRDNMSQNRRRRRPRTSYQPNSASGDLVACFFLLRMDTVPSSSSNSTALAFSKTSQPCRHALSFPAPTCTLTHCAFFTGSSPTVARISRTFANSAATVFGSRASSFFPSSAARYQCQQQSNAEQLMPKAIDHRDSIRS